MRFEQLEYLIEIARLHSITAASKYLHISQQSLSKSLQNLEEEIGASLFIRQKLGITLTPEGEKAIVQAKLLLTERDTLLQMFQPFRPSVLKGTLNLQYTQSFNPEMLSPALLLLHKHYPKISVNITQEANPQIINNILAGTCDIGFIILLENDKLNAKFLPEDPTLVTLVPLFTDELAVAVSSASPLAHQKSISMKKLLTLPLILLTHTNQDELTKNYIYLLLRSLGTPNFTFKTNDKNIYYNAILNQTGVGFAVRSFSDSPGFPKGITLVPIRENAILHHHYILSNTSPSAQIISAFTEFLSP